MIVREEVKCQSETRICEWKRTRLLKRIDNETLTQRMNLHLSRLFQQL